MIRLRYSNKKEKKEEENYRMEPKETELPSVSSNIHFTKPWTYFFSLSLKNPLLPDVVLTNHRSDKFSDFKTYFFSVIVWVMLCTGNTFLAFINKVLC